MCFGFNAADRGVHLRDLLRRCLGVSALTFALGCSNGGAGASVFNVSMNTSGLSGTQGLLVFDFVDGGPPDNLAHLGNLSGDGTPGTATGFGSVTGGNPWSFGALFGELQIAYTFGSVLSFSFSTTDDSPEGGSFPDSFQFFILDATGSDFLVTTSDPTGSNALFLDSIGIGADGVSVYALDQEDVTIQVAAVPEPNSPALLGIALAALAFRLRRAVADSRLSSLTRRFHIQ